ncbi:filamentous hemagglutinin N-terminal domain-containing protein [Sphingomonas mesophila]|uniref:filamentous hemagglutinin N-terminal domain-containing protein n=1 Tax=Sphingomonas mesophila TaxID=2303576 RepID=UPI000E58464A|nr:filamentous hemagglutinin N-terminal domain-containing protein [Sphingomonas mesophila]
MRTTLSRRPRTACSILALATALAAAPASAQVAGAGNFGAGTGSIGSTGTTTTVTLNDNRSVINWTVTAPTVGGVRTFLPSGSTLNFTGPTNFAVLNRLDTGAGPSVGLNGTVNGAGSIYFYNPNGIVVGTGAAFNVGSLVLTTLPITDANFVVGGVMNFDQAINPSSAVIVNSGANINALDTGSYVAMVAPRVVHNGNITTNGQAALVGAEAATINFSPDGLFDIEVTSGTSDVNGVVIGGSIGGAQSTGFGDNNRIYAVAVPKNQAMTMAITAGASLGFNLAGRVDVVGNAIVLSAGHNVVDGEVAGGAAPGGGSGDASVSGQNFTATSALTMVGKTDAEIIATTAKTMHSDVSVRGTREARIVSSSTGGNLTILGDAEVRADLTVAAGASGTAGIAALYAADGGLLTVQGDVAMSADATGLGSLVAGTNGASVTGGSVRLQAQTGGTVDIWGSATLFADATAGNGSAAGANGGNAIGGTVNVGTFDDGSDLTIGSHLSASVDGAGGYAVCDGCNGVGGTGVGGTIYVGVANNSDGATVSIGDFESFVSLSADGFGGGSSGGVAGATGTGGTVYVWSQGVASDVQIQGEIYASASGFGGSSFASGVNGGLGDGGNIYVLAHISDSNLVVSGTTSLMAEGFGGQSGGEGCSTCTGIGGDAVGGEIQLTTFDALGAGANLRFEGLVSASVDASGGTGISGGGNAIAGGTAGSGSIGILTNFAAGTTIEYNGGLDFSAVGEGGLSYDGNGGNGTGGRIRIGAQGAATGGSLTVNGNSVADVSGKGGDSWDTGTGGFGQGGQTDNGGNAGTLTFNGDFTALSLGTGGISDFGIGGGAQGGSAWLDAFGTLINVTGTVSIDASATGGSGSTGGGSGIGGRAIIAATSSNYTIGTDAIVRAEGTGGSGNTGTGGYGGGGEAIIRATGGNLGITGSALASTDSSGGSGANGGLADADNDPNTGIGGARIRASNNSQLTIGTTATVTSRAFGGQGFGPAGGNAIGGLAQILAFSGGDISVGGLTRVDTDAFAGNSANGSGGFSQVSGLNGATITLDRLNLRADGYGGDDAGNEAGDGYGGTAVLEAVGTGAVVTVTNNIVGGPMQDREMLSADGVGGVTYGNGGAFGGDGTGGTVNLFATSGGTVNLATTATTDAILIRARGYGGVADAENTTGGEGFGGTLNLTVNAGTMTTGFLQYSNFGQGGFASETVIDASGGDGFGGSRNVSVLGGGTLTTAIVGGIAGGLGGDGKGTGNGGNGSGGTASLTVNGSTLIGIGNIGITTQVAGGNAPGVGNAGSASGPNSVNVNITNSTVNMASGSLFGFYATAVGGNAPGGVGGGATAGTVNATINGSTISGGSIVATSVANGGDGLTGGGNGVGGTTNFSTANAVINVQGLRIDGSASGGWTASGIAGNASAGVARLNNYAGTSTITLASPLEVRSEGVGGSITGSDGAAGSGTGNLAQVFAGAGTTLTINAATLIDSSGEGGANAGIGSGGVGDGGISEVFSNAGTINLNGALTAIALGAGGNATAGLGGNGVGGSARVGTVGGTINVNGALALNASATGGSGAIGGNAAALLTTDANEEEAGAASIFVNGNGTISVTGSTLVDISATGGAGSEGNGGNAQAGELDAVPYVGDILLGNLTVNGNATGGSGAFGGNGGNATGGNADITFGFGAEPVDGLLSMGTVNVSLNGVGGAGGAGADGVEVTNGGAGGAGGSGTGGAVLFAGSAAGGTLAAGNVTLSATGTGGAGGNGGNGFNGGNGGAGGAGTGGFAIAGAISATNSPGSGGDFDVANLSANSSATGGNGGAGGLGAVSAGNGGNGGNAFGGESYLWIRGIDGSADAITLTASATGGAGGNGAVRGNGGNATTGLVQAEAKDRFGHPTQRGNLVADSITATAVATGGSGAINGTSTVFGGNFFRVLNGDATIGSVSFTIGGDLYDDSYYSDYVSVRDGTADIGTFSYVTSQALALDAGNGSMIANSITLDAGNFRAVRADVPAPTVVGSYTADSFAILTDADFITNANLNSTGGLAIAAPGSINMRGASAANILSLSAQSGSLGAGNLSAASISADAGAAVMAGNLTGGSAQIDSVDGDITFGTATLTGNLSLNSQSGEILGGNVSAGGSLNAQAARVTLGAIDADTGVDLTGYEGVTVGDILSGGNVSLFASQSGSSINAGDINSGGNVDLNSETIIAGDIVAVGFIDLFAGGLDTITVGNLTGDGISAVALGNITTGNIDSSDSVNLVSFDGNITTGNIAAVTTVYIEAAGNIGFLTGAATEFVFEAGGTATGGNITALNNVDGESGDAMVLGNVTVTGPSIEGFSVGLDAGGSIQVGNVSGTDMVGFTTPGDFTAGTIYGGYLILGLIGGDIVTGALTTSSNGQVYIGNSSMYGAAGGGSEETEFDLDMVLGVNPVATGGSLTVNGAIDTPLIRVAIGEAISGGDISVEGAFSMLASSITFGDITATGFIDLVATGAIVTGDLTAGGSVSLSGGSVVTGNIVTNAPPPQLGVGFTTMDVGPGTPVEIFSDDDIVTGNITTSGYVGLYAADDITAGSINAGHDVIALAGGDASFGPITTPERVILAGYGNLDQLYGVETFDPELIFGLWPVESTGGNAIFAGTSNVAQSFQVYAGGNVVLNSLSVNGGEFNSGFVGIDSGGTIGIAGNVSSDYIDLASRDINIAPTAQITARGISFGSINPNGTYIGDNLPGTDGYRLSQAELDRVDSSFYGFDVLGDRGAAQMMMVGDLTLDLSGESDDEGADFEIYSDDAESEEETLGGIIRIVGDVNLISSVDKTVYFTAQTVAIDAATGSLSLSNGSGVLNGLIEFEANNIFVASGTIIDKLIVNPRYDGHVAELNAPAAVQRPEGVLRAGAIDFNDDQALENLLVQNTGTSATPAGFVVLSESAYYDGEDGGPEDGEELPAPGSINLVINGQIQTPTGTLTGAAVRDALVEEYGSTEPFTANSTINGCPVSGGSCGSSTGGGLPPEAVITPTTITILASDPLGESVFGNEGDIAGDTGDTGGDEGGDEGGSASSPIDAPQPLFDTRPLNSDEDVNEPISGAGNPSLYGVSSDEDDDEDEEEDGKKKSEPKAAKQTNARTGDGQ